MVVVGTALHNLKVLGLGWYRRLHRFHVCNHRGQAFDVNTLYLASSACSVAFISAMLGRTTPRDTQVLPQETKPSADQEERTATPSKSKKRWWSFEALVRGASRSLQRFRTSHYVIAPHTPDLPSQLLPLSTGCQTLFPKRRRERFDFYLLFFYFFPACKIDWHIDSVVLQRRRLTSWELSCNPFDK